MQCALAVLNCRLWPAPLYHIFPHYLINSTFFRMKVTEHKMCLLIFSTPFVWNTSRRHTDSMKLQLICILLLSHSFIFFRFYLFINVYMVVFLFNTVIYVFLLCLCILIVCLCIFIVPAGTLRLPWMRFYRAFSSVLRQMPRYNSQRRGTARTLPKMFVLFYVRYDMIWYI
jgi:hypothetical protein